jgi:predicted nuclease of predicted toxin-antitoxin system
MKFLTDQDVYITTVRHLRDLGHDVITASEIGFSQADDIDLLKKANEQNRVFITRDRDFGGLVFVERLGSGVIYLRMQPSTQNAVHEELKRMLKIYSEDELKKAFIVVEPGRHRFRRLTDPGEKSETGDPSL